MDGTSRRRTDFPILSGSESKTWTSASLKTGIDSVASNNTKEGFMIIDTELLCAYLDLVSTCKICYSYGIFRLRNKVLLFKMSMSLTSYCNASD